MSLRELRDAREDQLTPGCTDEAYRAVGRALGWDILGSADDELALTEFRSEPGTLAQKRWEALTWSMPEKETDACWWITNACAEDASQEPSLLSRSLACLRLELNLTRCATSAKLRQCVESRSDDNAKAVDVLLNNLHLWRHVGGPDPELLFRPCAADLEMCREVTARLGELKEREDDRDGLNEFADEIIKAVELLKSVEWEDIRVERYNMTPPALFSDMVRTAESLLHRQAAEMSDGRGGAKLSTQNHMHTCTQTHSRCAFRSLVPSSGCFGARSG